MQRTVDGKENTNTIESLCLDSILKRESQSRKTRQVYVGDKESVVADSRGCALLFQCNVSSQEPLDSRTHTWSHWCQVRAGADVTTEPGQTWSKQKYFRQEKSESKYRNCHEQRNVRKTLSFRATNPFMFSKCWIFDCLFSMLQTFEECYLGFEEAGTDLRFLQPAFLLSSQQSSKLRTLTTLRLSLE